VILFALVTFISTLMYPPASRMPYARLGYHGAPSLSVASTCLPLLSAVCPLIPIASARSRDCYGREVDFDRTAILGQLVRVEFAPAFDLPVAELTESSTLFQ
jgi:hypothetical protein